MTGMEKIRKFAKENFGSLNYFHTLDVVRIALQIAEKENADKEVVEAAAWLHDAGKIKKEAKGGNHEIYSAEVAAALLKENKADEGFIKKVLDCIKEHMGPPGKKLKNLLDECGRKFEELPRPSTKESKCLYDADMINFLGPYGIAKVIHLNAKNGRDFAESIRERMQQTEEAYSDLQTEAGKEIAEEYYGIAKEFFKKIILEER